MKTLPNLKTLKTRSKVITSERHNTYPEKSRLTFTENAIFHIP
jgi:hypothetical protein